MLQTTGGSAAAAGEQTDAADHIEEISYGEEQ